MCRHAQHSAGDARGLEVSLGGFLQDQFIQRQIGDGSPEMCVLPLELLEASGLPNLQAAVLLAPPIVRLLGDAQGPARFWHRVTARQADFSLTQLADDLFRGMSLPWHLDLLSNGPSLTFRLGQVLGGRSDIFSRCVVGWMVADRENAALAATLIEETCLKQGIEPQVLTLHSDRGAPMTSKCTAQLLADLGATRSLSRPQVSDDNPFSEAQFKTLKYRPGFPGRFEDITAAIAFCRSFFPWYNTEHRHAGIAMLTPDDVHHHRAPDVLAQRGRTLQAAWALHPERFVHGTPKPAPLPEAVWINPPATSTTGETSQ